MRRALDLEPVSSIFNSCLAQVLYAARRYDEAVTHCQTAIELEPGNPHPYAWFGMVNIQRGDQPAAERAFRQGLSASSFIPRIHGAWGYSQAIHGDRSGALAHLERLEELARERTVDPCFEAWILTGLGDHEAALTRLEDAYDRGATWLICLGFDPFFDTVRDQPRYRKLLAQLNLLEVRG
jgi:predicted Zn-dependent protease